MLYFEESVLPRQPTTTEIDSTGQSLLYGNVWRCSIFHADHAISLKNMITR